jgi:zinc D-Ala-D-Ala carboxypeptidase
MKYFSEEDYKNSETATRKGIVNEPTEHQFWKFEMITYWLLDPLRTYLGQPVYISSGFRSKLLNSTLMGASGSQHMAEECWVAVDIVTERLEEAFNWLKLQEFDQIILEEARGKKWIHLSLRMDDQNRNEILKYLNGRYEHI